MIPWDELLLQLHAWPLPQLPETPAGRIETVMWMLNPVDESGNELPPFITREQACRLLDVPLLPPSIPLAAPRWMLDLWPL